MPRTFACSMRRNVLRKIDGIWYHFILAEIPRGRYAYSKPEGRELFQRPGAKRKKTWGQLCPWEQRELGVAHFEGESAVDAYTGKRVYLDEKTPGQSSINADCLSAALHHKYHRTKKTAAHRELKRAGLAT